MAPGHSPAHAVFVTTPVPSKVIKRTCQWRMGLGNGLGSGSRRYIGLSFRTRDQENTVFEAVPAEPPSMLMTLIDLTQAFSIFMVMGIQIGLIIRKQSAVVSKPTLALSKTTPTPSDPLFSLVEHQPLFLAWALACALCARLFSPRKMEIQAKGVATQALRQKADTVEVKATLRHVERQMGKMQSRVLICAEQFRTMRRSNDESRVVTNQILTQHGTALAEVQEQANSLQRVLSSLQDVVVKQIEVITPPIKSLNSRVRALEEELQELKGRTDPKLKQSTLCGSGTPEPSSMSATAAMQQCSPVQQHPEDISEPQTGINLDPRTTQKSDSAVPHRLRHPSGSSAAKNADSAADAAAATGRIDSVISSAGAEFCTLAAGVYPAANPAPQFPVCDGRMMQISWRGTGSDAARDDSPHAPGNQSTCALRSDSFAAAADLQTQSGSAVGLMMRTTWQLGTGTASSQEVQWSKQEQSAMAVRLQDLCCSYDAATVMDCQSLRRSKLVAVAASEASGDGTAGDGTLCPSLSQSVDQKWHQMGVALRPVSFGCTVETQGRGQQENHGDERVALTSVVPDHGHKLQAVGVPVGQLHSVHETQAGPSTDLRGTAEQDCANHGDIRDTGSTVLMQHGLLTLLTFAASSVLWAQPVV